MNNCCVDKKSNGFLSGLLYGLIPHSGCILFFIFAVIGATTISSFFRSFLLSRYSFYWLIAISLVLAAISAAIYLIRIKSFSFIGIRNNWRYLSTLFSGIVTVNLLFFLVVFPFASNYFSFNGSGGAALISANSKLVISTDIPCSGHAPLIINDLEKLNGVGDVKFSFPDSFIITYDSGVISKEDILLANILKIFKAKEK